MFAMYKGTNDMENPIKNSCDQRSIVTITMHDNNYKMMFIALFENANGDGFPFESSLN